MDFWMNYSFLDNDLSDFPLLALQAQQFLQQTGWSYYTIWKAAHNPPGLAWSRGQVNELLINECNLISEGCRNTGLLLQEFYSQCSFLPLGLGMAGEAFACRQTRWASGEELLLQINVLSSQNQQLLPLASALGLHAHYFKTIVCIPLEMGAGVLEIGTTELVQKTDASNIYQMLGFINGLATQGTPRVEQIMSSSSFEAGTVALPNDAGNQYGQYLIAAGMKTDGCREIFRYPSNTSSHSSTTSSSTPPASDQMGNVSNTSFVLNASPAQVSSMNNEDNMIMSPASSLQAAPKSIINSFDELNKHGVNAPTLPDIDRSGLINKADLIHFPHDDHLQYLSAQDVDLQGLHMPIRGEELLDSRCLDPHSEPNTHHNNLLDCVPDPNMACQTEVSSISCLKSFTCQVPSRSVSYSNDDQHQQWRDMSPSMNEGNDLFGQLEQYTHALAGDSLGDKMSNDQGGETVVSSTVTLTTQDAPGRYGSYASRSAEADNVVGSSTSKDGGSYVNYAYGSHEGYKLVVGLSTAAGSYGSYESGSAEADKVVTFPATASLLYVGADSIIGSGKRDDHYKVQQGNEFIGLQLGVQKDDKYNIATSSFTNIAGRITPHQNVIKDVNPAQVHHVQAERNRRHKEGDCINNLRTLVPTITKKMDKVAVLENTIRHIKELEDRIRELEQEKESRSHENATCNYVEDTIPHFEDTMPHFRLSLIKNVQDVEANATLIKIMHALQKNNLDSFEINSKFLKNTSTLSLQILANYKKDGGSYSPNMDEIQRIKQWWEHYLQEDLALKAYI